MSPFEVYLMFQADSLIGFFTGAAIFTLVATTLGGLFWLFSCDEDCDFPPQVHKALGRGTSVALIVVVLASLGATLTPSTKTIAAMVVLPKLTSPTALKALGGQEQELVDAATAALKSLAAPKEPRK